MIQEKEKQSQAEFILYQWDSLENFPYIERMHKFFDRCYSFDRKDVQKDTYIQFLPLFYSERYERIAAQHKKEYKYAIKLFSLNELNVQLLVFFLFVQHLF